MMDLFNDRLAFSSVEACKLSGVGFKRLDGWARSGFIAPSVQAPSTTYHFRRRYSFQDIIELAVARKLRDTGFSLDALRQIKKVLRRDFHPLPKRLISDGHDVFELRQKQTLYQLAPRHGQACLPLTILDVGRTVQELLEIAAVQRDATIAEIREQIARGEMIQRKKTRRSAVPV
jgi:DNA-binding transcriptional MerR regulator